MNYITLIILSFFAAIVSIILDIKYGNELFVLFQRSGSLIVIFGALFEYVYILKISAGSTVYVQELKIGLDSEEAKRNTETIIINLKKHLGFYFILIGTLIWGYGDLVGKLFS